MVGKRRDDLWRKKDKIRVMQWPAQKLHIVPLSIQKKSCKKVRYNELHSLTLLNDAFNFSVWENHKSYAFFIFYLFSTIMKYFGYLILCFQGTIWYKV